LGVLLCALLTLVPSLLGQSPPNPVPFVNQPLVPSAVAPGGPSFTLTVNGTGFVPASVVNWNGSPRPTTFVSNSHLTAAIDAADITLARTASVTVVSPSPGGGTSNVVSFQITAPSSSVRFTRTELSLGPTAVNPAYGVTTGDFNGDGKLDLAVTSGDLSVSVAVFVLLGNGDGTFQPATSYPLASQYVSDLIARDFNGDGKLDLAVADGTYGAGRNLSIMLGNGDGTFQSPVNYATDGWPVALAAADFNRDGKLDLVVANNFYYVVSVLLGNGDGTFQAYQTFDVPPDGHDVAVGDFNRDDNQDIAVCGLGTISVLLGTGAGSFAPANTTILTADRALNSFSVADLNGDGKLDLAIGGRVDRTNFLSTTLGYGFQPLVNYALDGEPYSVTAGDFNGDGILDVAVANGNVLSIFLGNGDGTYQAHMDSPTGHMPFSVAVGDFNRDGRLDAVVAESGYPDQVSVLLQPSFVQLGPSSVAFANRMLGSTSPPQTVTLTSNLPGPLTIASVALTGTDPADFTETNDCPIAPATLESGDSCTISVTFAPQTTGAKTAAITVSDDAPGSPQQVVNLSGTSINPAVTLSATSLDFGNQNLNTTSPPQTVTLTNSGAGPLTIMSISASADFAQSNDCGASVAEGAQCTISVTFTPATAGTRTGAVTITDNAVDSPQTISLTGTGVPATLTLSTTSLTFGEQNVGTTSAPQTVTVTNSGTGPLVIFSIGASGDFPQTHNCPISPATIGPSASCTISLTFRPTGGGTRTGLLTLADNASGNPHNVNLTGTGVAPTISVLPTSLDFGDQRVGTTSAAQAVTVTNTGGGPATIFSISTSAEFAQTGNCPLSPATLAASASCSINVTFRPSARGTRTGSLTLTDNATGNPHTVSLTGNGLAPDVGLSPAALNFPDQAVGVTSPPQDVTLSNTGNRVLNITGFLVTSAFAYVSGCGATVAVSASCTITVTFTPNVAGTTYGAVVISDDAPGSPQTVSLTGTTAVNFGQQPVGQTSAPQIVSLTNTSSTPRVITGIAVTGDFAQSSACGTLAAGQSCPVNLTFTPAAQGTRSGALVIADNAPGSPHTMTLSGTGTGFALNVQSGGSASATVNAGQTAIYNLQIEPGGFSGNVALSCAFQGTQPRGASCSVSPSSVALNGTVSAPLTVRVSTTARTLAAPNPFSQQGPRGSWARHAVPLPSAWVIVLAMLLGIAGVAAAFRPAPGNPRLEPLRAPPTGTLVPGVVRAATLVAVLVWAACGGGGSAPPPPQDRGTPAGNYPLVLSATATGVTETINLGLHVN
jgi:hypothetical protein